MLISTLGSELHTLVDHVRVDLEGTDTAQGVAEQFVVGALYGGGTEVYDTMTGFKFLSSNGISTLKRLSKCLFRLI